VSYLKIQELALENFETRVGYPRARLRLLLFVNGYGITAGGLMMESAIYGGAIGGVGYLGYRIGGGQ
jgi:hypothetical protein